MGVFRYVDRWQAALAGLWRGSMSNDAQLDELMRLLEERDRQLEDWLAGSGGRLPWSPAITATSNPNIGSTGTAVGDYALVDGECRWRLNITFLGTGVSGGSGSWAIAMPPVTKLALSNGFEPCGAGWYYHSAGFTTVACDMSPGDQSMRAVYTNGVVGHNTPAAPMAGAVLSLSGFYPIAAN